jgi:cytochrome o ubiquinol oxidase subunit 1
MPLYALGLMGATRRMEHYDNVGWQPLMLVAAAGAAVILVGIILMIVQLVVSIRQRDAHRDLTGDPWNGRTLEWSTASPPPIYNYAVQPRVDGEYTYWALKQKNLDPSAPPDYQPIEVPRNSAIGFVLAFFAVVTGFAMIWHIWWMAIVGLIGAFIAVLVFAWRDDTPIVIPAEEVARIERLHPHGPQLA